MEQYLGFFLALGIMAMYLIVANLTFKPKYYLDRQKTWITDKSPEHVAMMLQHMLKTELALNVFSGNPYQHDVYKNRYWQDLTSDSPYWQDITESLSDEGILLQAKLTVKIVSHSISARYSGTQYYSILLSINIKYVANKTDNKTVVIADYKTKGYGLFIAPEINQMVLQPLIDKNKAAIGHYLDLP